MIILKRAYDYKDLDPASFTILVDRLWPRGLKKNDLQPNEWLREIAPSPGLRSWFGHDPGRFEAFRAKYLEELKTKDDLLKKMKQFEREQGQIILLYGARDTQHNNATVLKEALTSM